MFLQIIVLYLEVDLEVDHNMLLLFVYPSVCLSVCPQVAMVMLAKLSVEVHWRGELRFDAALALSCSFFLSLPFQPTSPLRSVSSLADADADSILARPGLSGNAGDASTRTVKSQHSRIILRKSTMDRNSIIECELSATLSTFLSSHTQVRLIMNFLFY